MAKKGAKGAAAAAAAGGATVAAKKSRGEGINTKLALVMKSGKVRCGAMSFPSMQDDYAYARTHPRTIYSFLFFGNLFLRASLTPSQRRALVLFAHD